MTRSHVVADGHELKWRGDVVESNAFAFTAPSGAKTLTANCDDTRPSSGGCAYRKVRSGECGD